MKIIVIGSSGAGKSTFSRQIGELFIKLIWNYRRDKRPAVLEKLSKHAGHAKIIIIRTPKEARTLIRNIQNEGPSFFEKR